MYQVIIIEDDPMVAAIDKQYVEADSQFRVVRTFKSGGEALAHLPELKADLIILDYYTPGMNGTEFVDQLHTRFLRLTLQAGRKASSCLAFQYSSIMGHCGNFSDYASHRFLLQHKHGFSAARSINSRADSRRSGSDHCNIIHGFSSFYSAAVQNHKTFRYLLSGVISV